MSRPGRWLAIIIWGLFLPISSVYAGTISATDKYAWSDNNGYINFGNVTVDDSVLGGYAWSANHGWIKFDPAKGGVFNDGAGNLSGSAWGEGLGWIDFSGVRITSEGIFTGQATGDLVGTLTFDCPNYCRVVTDWRPAQQTTGQAVASGGGGSVLGVYSKVTASNVPLTIVPEQSGLLEQLVGAGKATVDVPAGILSLKTTFRIIEEPLSPANLLLLPPGAELLDGAIFKFTAQDASDSPVESFRTALTVSLPAPKDPALLVGVGVYALGSTNQHWNLIPDAVFHEGQAIFQTNHLAPGYALLRVSQGSAKPPSLPITPSPSAPAAPGTAPAQPAGHVSTPTEEGTMPPAAPAAYATPTAPGAPAASAIPPTQPRRMLAEESWKWSLSLAVFLLIPLIFFWRRKC